MKDFTQLNVEQICSIKVYFKNINHDYEYREYKKSFFCTRKEGFYYDDYYSSHLVTEENIIKGGRFYCEDKKVFYKPHIVIRMNNNSSHTMYFDSADELNVCLEQKDLRKITLINVV